MRRLPTPEELGNSIDTMLQTIRYDETIDLLTAAIESGRPITDAERETVVHTLCRLVGMLLDAARAAERLGGDPETVQQARDTADSLLKSVNFLNGWGEDGQ